MAARKSARSAGGEPKGLAVAKTAKSGSKALPDPTYFESPAAFRAWLVRHHARLPEVLVGFHKTGTGRPSMTWPESVREALCFGWIDGVRRRVDEERYSIRFTPRKAGSVWSNINVAHVKELIELKLMQPAGMAAYAARSEKRTGIYAFENEGERALSQEDEARLKANQKAWAFFEALSPGAKRLAIFRVTSPKKRETQVRRLDKLIADCLAGKRPDKL